VTEFRVQACVISKSYDKVLSISHLYTELKTRLFELFLFLLNQHNTVSLHCPVETFIPYVSAMYGFLTSQKFGIHKATKINSEFRTALYHSVL
jgi:hypothetical protein